MLFEEKGTAKIVPPNNHPVIITTTATMAITTTLTITAVTRYRAWGVRCVPGTRLRDVIQREEDIDRAFKEPVVGWRRQKSHRSNFNYLHLLH